MKETELAIEHNLAKKAWLSGKFYTIFKAKAIRVLPGLFQNVEQREL